MGGGGGKDLPNPPSFCVFPLFCESSEFSVQNFLLVKLDKKNLYRSNIDPPPTNTQHAKIHESATNKTTKLFTRNKTPAAHPRPSPPPTTQSKTIKHKNKTVHKNKKQKNKNKIPKPRKNALGYRNKIKTCRLPRQRTNYSKITTKIPSLFPVQSLHCIQVANDNRMFLCIS